MFEIKAIFWDMDGVLIDSEKFVQRAFVEVMTRNGVMDDAAERFKEVIGMNRHATLLWYSQFCDSTERAEQLFDEVGGLCLEWMRNELTLKQGVVAALQSVKRIGLPQMVVTSTKYELAVAKLERFDLLPFFTDIIGGDQVTHGKPHAEPYLAAADRLYVPACNALVIEDSANGVKAGLAAGAMVVHVPDLIPTDAEWVDDIYATLDSLELFPAWLAKQACVN